MGEEQEILEEELVKDTPMPTTLGEEFLRLKTKVTYLQQTKDTTKVTIGITGERSLVGGSQEGCGDPASIGGLQFKLFCQDFQ